MPDQGSSATRDRGIPQRSRPGEAAAPHRAARRVSQIVQHREHARSSELGFEQAVEAVAVEGLVRGPGALEC